MNRTRAIPALLSAAALCAFALTAAAQDDDVQPGGGYGYLLDNIDLLLDRYSSVLARKYDLNEEQETFTHELIHAKAHQFIDQHKPELRQLVNCLFEVRTGGEMDPQELIDWGKRALPLYNEAKMLIVEGNAEWREILTEEQRHTHDEDLKRMHEGFRTTEEQLERIVTGRMTIEEFRNPQRTSRKSRPRPESPSPPRKSLAKRSAAAPPPPTPAAVRPGDVRRADRSRPTAPPRPPYVSPRPTKPTPERVSRSPGPRPSKTSSTAVVAGKDYESKWEAYVREFIEKYKLSDEQSQRAYAILKDCQQRAERHMKAGKRQLEELDRILDHLKGSKDADKAEHLKKINDRRAKLLEPIQKIFERQLKPGLEKLPTSAQRRAAEAAAKKPGQKTERSERDAKDEGG